LKKKKRAQGSAKKARTTIGWEEWCALPGLDLPAIKAKIDTGARTSALHAYDIRTFRKDGQIYVSFKIHPLQRNDKVAVKCTAPLKDKRVVTSSNGEKEKRYVIETRLCMGDVTFMTELTLTSRHKMTFRMLLGREALRKAGMVVDPARSYVLGKLKNASKHYKTEKGKKNEDRRIGIRSFALFQ